MPRSEKWGEGQYDRWLTGRLAPDFKAIAAFRKDFGEPIRKVGRAFVAICRTLELLSRGNIAIDGSKFRAVNARDKNLTQAKMKRCLERIDKSIARYLGPARDCRSPGRDRS